ncbi:MAG: hypothetical protein J6O41_07250 [Clostridia bacterium]|nr:hypothetical protein [Clostridia bacterium]
MIQLIPFKEIVAIGFVAGVIIVIIRGDMIFSSLPVEIQFIISDISVFAGIISSISSEPDKDQTHKSCFTKEYAKKALTGENENEKVEAISYLSNIIDDKSKIENKSLYN